MIATITKDNLPEVRDLLQRMVRETFPAAGAVMTIVGRRIVKPLVRTGWVFLFLTASSVSGQQPGDTVRVSGEMVVSGELVDVVVEADSSGLLLSSGYAPYAAMRSLELWVDSKGQAWRGFKKGLVVGGGLGFATGVWFGFAIDDNDDVPLRDWLIPGAVVGAVGAVGAGVVGALIGALVKSDIWEPVPIPGGLSIRLAVGG